MCPAQEPAGEDAGGVTLLKNDLAALEGCHIAGRLLHQAATAGWEVPHDPRAIEGQCIVIDEVHICLVPGCEDTAVIQPVHAGRVLGLALDHMLKAQAPAPGPVTGPVGQHEGGHAAVTDRAAVGTAVAEAQEGPGVLVQGVEYVEIAVGELGLVQQRGSDGKWRVLPSPTSGSGYLRGGIALPGRSSLIVVGGSGASTPAMVSIEPQGGQ